MAEKYPYNHEESGWEDRVRPPMESAYAPPEFMGILRDGAGKRETEGTFGAPETEGGEDDV